MSSAAVSLQVVFDAAMAIAETNAEAAVAQLREIVAAPLDEDDDVLMSLKEKAVYKLADIFTAHKRPHDIAQLLVDVRPFFVSLPKSKTSKIVRRLCDQFPDAGASCDARIEIFANMIEWARAEKQTFLRHRLQKMLASVYHEKGDAALALSIVNPLLKEVRRLEDRSLLVDIHLLESQIYYSIKSHAKSRASLVAARTNANSIYCPPLQQAEIDMQSGVLHAEEKDYKTSFSYLYEAFEGYHGLGDRRAEARRSLKMMLMMKILCDVPDELRAVLNAKNVLQYTGPDLDAVRQVAEAYRLKDTHLFSVVQDKYAAELSDVFTSKHLADMYDRLLEGHLLRLIQPYNRVQLSYLAEVLHLDAGFVEARLSQMILDMKLRGIVDQQHMCLIVFEEEHPDKLYTSALKTLDNLDKLVTALFDKVAGKFDHLIGAEEASTKKKKKEVKATSS